MLVKESDRLRNYDWVVFAQSYLYIARLACQELLNTETKHSKAKRMIVPYSSGDLFVPILFNVKHGIEVFIKAISLFAYGEYREGHDIHELFVEIKQRIAKLKLTPTEQKYYDSVSKQDIEKLPADFDRIEALVRYFYNLDLLKPLIGNDYKIRDSVNDVLRYPDSKAAVQIDWSTILDGRVTNTAIEEILEKTEDLSELLNKVGYIFAVLSRPASKNVSS